MILRTEGLTKVFAVSPRKRVTAVDDLSLTVEEGEIFGVVGPNGAGKTTTIKMLMGLIFPTRGRAFIFDAPIPSNASKARIGYLPENPSYHEFLTGLEALRFFAKLSGVPRAERKKRCEELLGMGASKIQADPRVGKMSPMSILMGVVFPAPFGPTKPKISPCATDRDRSFTASTRLRRNPTSNVFVSPSVRRIIAPHLLQPPRPCQSSATPARSRPGAEKRQRGESPALPRPPRRPAAGRLIPGDGGVVKGRAHRRAMWSGGARRPDGGDDFGQRSPPGCRGTARGSIGKPPWSWGPPGERPLAPPMQEPPRVVPEAKASLAPGHLKERGPGPAPEAP